MKQIFKYALSARTRTLYMATVPEGATVLSVQKQAGAWVCWAVVDPDAPPVVRVFVIKFTGDEAPEGPQYAYRDTHQADGLVYHVFEDLNEYARSKV